jgi:hypothetical protein
MSITYKQAKRENVPLLIGLDGPTSTGKTYSALLLATGIAETIGAAKGREGRVFVGDTERGRALHYADDFSFMHGEIIPPFTPDAYADAIDAAEQAGADVIVIDSFSHEWEGEGGVKDMADRLEMGVPKPGIANPEAWKRDHWIVQPVKSPQNWTDPKGAHRRLVNKMLAARAHIIVCLRAQEKMRVENVPVIGNDGQPERKRDGAVKTKMVITPSGDLPLLERWVPICEKGFPFEITTSFLLTPDEPGVPKPRKLTKAHRDIIPLDRPLSKQVGIDLAKWSMGASAPGAPTLEGARIAIRGAPSMQALESLWRGRAMAPFREELTAELEQRKAELTPAPEPEGPNDYEGV